MSCSSEYIRNNRPTHLRGYRLLLRQGALAQPPKKKKKEGFAVLLAFCVRCFWGNLAFLVSGFVFCSVLLAMAGDHRRSEGARDVPPAAHLLCCSCCCRRLRRLRGSNFSCCTT